MCRDKAKRHRENGCGEFVREEKRKRGKHEGRKRDGRSPLHLSRLLALRNMEVPRPFPRLLARASGQLRRFPVDVGRLPWPRRSLFYPVIFREQSRIRLSAIAATVLLRPASAALTASPLAEDAIALHVASGLASGIGTAVLDVPWISRLASCNQRQFLLFAACSVAAQSLLTYLLAWPPPFRFPDLRLCPAGALSAPCSGRARPRRKALPDRSRQTASDVVRGRLGRIRPLHRHFVRLVADHGQQGHGHVALDAGHHPDSSGRVFLPEQKDARRLLERPAIARPSPS